MISAVIFDRTVLKQSYVKIVWNLTALNLIPFVDPSLTTMLPIFIPFDLLSKKYLKLNPQQLHNYQLN
jgi:hypothetical protein